MPWIFAWTQTRLILPAWLGVADALQAAASSGKHGMLRDMYEVRTLWSRCSALRWGGMSAGPGRGCCCCRCAGFQLTCLAQPCPSYCAACCPRPFPFPFRLSLPLPTLASHPPLPPLPPLAPLPCLQHWPFFQSVVDLIEMVMSKADMRIAALYDQVLVEDPQVGGLGGVTGFLAGCACV